MKTEVKELENKLKQLPKDKVIDLLVSTIRGLSYSYRSIMLAKANKLIRIKSNNDNNQQ